MHAIAMEARERHIQVPIPASLFVPAVSITLSVPVYPTSLALHLFSPSPGTRERTARRDGRSRTGDVAAERSAQRTEIRSAELHREVGDNSISELCL
jgi:hypothetical protein